LRYINKTRIAAERPVLSLGSPTLRSMPMEFRLSISLDTTLLLLPR
jgi:hypothetical protein